MLRRTISTLCYDSSSVHAPKFNTNARQPIDGCMVAVALFKNAQPDSLLRLKLNRTYVDCRSLARIHCGATAASQDSCDRSIVDNPGGTALSPIPGQRATERSPERVPRSALAPKRRIFAAVRLALEHRRRQTGRIDADVSEVVLWKPQRRAVHMFKPVAFETEGHDRNSIWIAVDHLVETADREEQILERVARLFLELRALANCAVTPPRMRIRGLPIRERLGSRPSGRAGFSAGEEEERRVVLGGDTHPLLDVCHHGAQLPMLKVF
eukprot:6207922-Pleurochrysis_carterae.AAC.6